jgi:hypothetical protein
VAPSLTPPLLSTAASGGAAREKTRWWARQASHEWAAGEVAARGGGWGPADRDSSGSGGV